MAVTPYASHMALSVQQVFDSDDPGVWDSIQYR